MRPLVREHVPNGETIATIVETDCLIVAGVSNWGGYAIGAALYSDAAANHALGSHTLDDFLPEDGLMVSFDAMSAAGAVDSGSGQTIRQVDGLAMDVHLNVIARLRESAQRVS